MPETSEQASQRQRRANRIGVRTLRQRPKLVGALTDGEPVYEVRSVRLVLRGQTPHFNRLVACERCGQDQAGAPVLAPADLDLSVRPMICADCVQRAGVSSVWEPGAARPPAERVSPPAEEVKAPAEPPPTAPGPDVERLESIEHRLEAVAADVQQLSHLAEAQMAAQAGRRQSDEVTLAALRAEMTRALGGARSQIESVYEELGERVAEVTQVVEAQRVDLVVVVAELARREVPTPDAAGPTHVSASLAEDLDERLQELAAQVAQGMTRVDALLDADRMSSTRLAGIEERLERLAAQAGATASAEEVTTMHDVVDERLQELAARSAQGMARIDALLSANNEIASHLAGLEERLDRVAAELAVERSRASVAASAIQACASAEEMATLQAAVDERLRELAAQAVQGSASIDVLVDANSETSGRLAGFEQQLDRLAWQLTTGRSEAPVRPPATVAPTRGRNGLRLLDDLEVLLQGASERLSALSGIQRPQPANDPERRG